MEFSLELVTDQLQTELYHKRFKEGMKMSAHIYNLELLVNRLKGMDSPAPSVSQF